MLLTMILAGCFVPISVIGEIDAIKYMSLFSPINYSTSLLNNSLIMSIDGFSQSIFDFQDFSISPANPTDGPIIIITAWQKVLNLIMPIIIFVGFNFVAYKKFSWSSR